MFAATFPSLLEVEADLTGGTSTCWIPLRAWSWALIRAAAAAVGQVRDETTSISGSSIPAAAAGSTGDLTSGVVLSRFLDRGLRSRPESNFSVLRAGGERDLRSKREALRGSGSVWSKRDLFALRRSVSSILSVECLEAGGWHWAGVFENWKLMQLDLLSCASKKLMVRRVDAVVVVNRTK